MKVSTLKQYEAKLDRIARASRKKPHTAPRDQKWPVIHGIRPTPKRAYQSICYGCEWSGEGHITKDGWQLSIEITHLWYDGEVDHCGDLHVYVHIYNVEEDDIEGVALVRVSNKKEAVAFVKMAIKDWNGVK